MFNSLIIGAGQVASGFDDLKSKTVLSHAHAYRLNENINLLGFYDIDFKKSKESSLKWQAKAYKNLDEINEKVDIVSVCTPDEFHLKSVYQALEFNPKVIFLEKPIALNKEDALKIVEISKKVPILVNFSRRFVKEFQILAEEIKSGLYGDFVTGNGFYGKGYIHNGSHMRDLLELLLGEVEEKQTISEFHDFYDNDLTKTIILSIKNKPFFMQGIDCNNFTVFEFDLFFKKGRVRILSGGNGIEIYGTAENHIYKGYINLKLQRTIKTCMSYAMENAVQNIEDFLTKGEKLLSVPYYRC